MMYLWVVILTVCVVFCLYTVVQSRKHPLATFVLIPLLLVGSVYSVNLFYHIQGTPRNGLPQGQVEVLYVGIAKPSIYVLVQSQQAEHPVYYRMDYTKQRAQQMRKLQEKMSKEQLRGEFKVDGGTGQMTQDNIIFENIKHIPLPPKEQ